MLRFFLVLILFKFGASADECIERPCPGNNLDCIRNYFITHSRARPIKGIKPDIVIRPDTAKVSYAEYNITGFYENLSYKGIKANIVDFYINPTTDKAVLSVVFPSLTLTTLKAAFYFHQLGLEPLFSSDYGKVTIKSLFVTATIPNINNLQMKDVFINAYNFDPHPTYKLGDNLQNDYVTKPLLDKLFSDVPYLMSHFVQEVAPFGLHMFVKYNICDFKLPLNVYLQ